MAFNTTLYSMLGLVISGDIGGVTVYRNRNGKVVFFPKTKTGPATSVAQAATRIRFAEVMQSMRHIDHDYYWRYRRFLQRHAIKFCTGAFWQMAFRLGEIRFFQMINEMVRQRAWVPEWAFVPYEPTEWADVKMVTPLKSKPYELEPGNLFVRGARTDILKFRVYVNDPDRGYREYFPPTIEQTGPGLLFVYGQWRNRWWNKFYIEGPDNDARSVFKLIYRFLNGTTKSVSYQIFWGAYPKLGPHS